MLQSSGRSLNVGLQGRTQVVGLNVPSPRTASPPTHITKSYCEEVYDEMV